jgi:hypothetical protein
MKNVSQFMTISWLGLLPSSPIGPVTKGRSSGSTSRPLSALATPQPSRSATSTTSSAALAAPWPTSIATRSPAFSTSAARARSCSLGITRGRTPLASLGPLHCVPLVDEYTTPCSRGGSSKGSSCTSAGKITQVTDRAALATWMARSIR